MQKMVNEKTQKLVDKIKEDLQEFEHLHDVSKSVALAVVLSAIAIKNNVPKTEFLAMVEITYTTQLIILSKM